ncbi:MAG: Stage V sporulation protein E [Parcubacteria group bacterium GW2011_GWF2_44_8b]|nr:MAG: Stage V sporulation protein E [Parcubacteria group bacterium GW2011_GWF2_44_8b]KKT85244.1 MAG: Stage V sporulation protein E [Parcubacteria group bacterium GW2011_GWD1_44_9]
MAGGRKVDKSFLLISIILIVAGFFIFSSASLALLAKESSNYSSIAFSQTVFGLFAGTVVMIIVSRLDSQIWKKSAFWLLLIAIIINILVLVPGIGFEHAGARRWIKLGAVSFQTSEMLKLAFIIYFAAWVAGVKEKMKTFYWGFLPLLVLFAISAVLLLKQPDTDNLILIIIAGVAMFIAAGGKWRYVFSILLAVIIGLALLAYARPYVMQRITTFLNPQTDIQGASYQVQQSLIAVGSGGLFGRGFGQSVQKFTYLPEPVGDSIFAVAAEEFGFVGSVFLLIMFVLFATRGIKIASETSGIFGRLTVVGIVIMITSQAFVNIGAMLGVIPLSGITLPFVSHGGTSLFFTLLEVGIVLSISRIRGS